MKKKIQNLLIVSLIIALLTGNASATFSDVSAGAWYTDSVNFVNEIGIMVGDTNGNFNPDKPVTRAEMAVILYRTIEATWDENDYAGVLTIERFSDVAETHWASLAINKVLALSLVSGYGNGRFGPSDPVTYEQAVTMIVRAIGSGTDAENRGGYPKGFLAVASDLELLADMRASSGEKLSRANVAVLLCNYFSHYMSSAEHLTTGNTTDNTPSTPGNEIGLLGNINSAQDNQTGNTLEIGGPQQENQPDSSSESGGIGGGA